MRSKLLHGFVKCSDGRLYHRALGPIAIQQYEKLKAGNIKRLQGRARSHKHPHPDDGNADVTRYETRTKRVTSASPNASPNAHREESRVQAAAQLSDVTRYSDQTKPLEIPGNAVVPDTGQAAVAASRATPVWSREECDLLEQRCRAAAGVEDSPAIGLTSLAPILSLLADGFDLDRDILPVLIARRQRGAHGQSWNFYVGEIRDNRAANTWPQSVELSHLTRARPRVHLACRGVVRVRAPGASAAASRLALHFGERGRRGWRLRYRGHQSSCLS